MIWVTKPEPREQWHQSLKWSVHRRTLRLRAFGWAHIHLKNKPSLVLKGQTSG